MRGNPLFLALVIAGFTIAMVAPRAASAFVRPAPPPGFERNGNGGWTYKPPAPVKPGAGGIIPGGRISIPKPGGGFGSVGIGFKPAAGAIGATLGGMLRGGVGMAALGLGAWAIENCIKDRGGSWVFSCGEDPEIDWGPWIEPYGRSTYSSAGAACRGGARKQGFSAERVAQVEADFGVADEKTAGSACCGGDGGCLFQVYRHQITGDPDVIPDDELDRMLETAPVPALPVAPYPVTPIINPSPGPDPQPMPFRMPIGDPVVRVDPDTGEQYWAQPGLELVQSPALDDPLRLDSKPYEERVDGPARDTETETETQAKPDKTKPGTTTGTATATDTATETETGTKPAPGGGAKPEAPEPFDPCEAHPDILACQKLGDLDDSTLKEVDVPMDIRPYGNGGGGSCPAPRQASFFGHALTISYQPICDFAVMIRPMVLALAWLSAALIFAGAARRS